MKKYLMLVVVGGVLLASNGAFAHCGSCGVGDAAPAADADHATHAIHAEADKATIKSDKMAGDLGLSDEQKAQVKAAMEEKMALKQAAVDAYHAKLKTILNEEQLKKHNAMHEGGCPMCKDGKMCEMCKLKKNGMDKGIDCPMCALAGGMCEKCKLMKK